MTETQGLRRFLPFQLRRLTLGWLRERADRGDGLRVERDLRQGLGVLKALSTPAIVDDQEVPIFLLSAGWRSGSTLLQRCIMSDPNVLMWGEPYQETGIVQLLASAVRAFRHDWPKAQWFLQEGQGKPSANSWVANLFPSIDDWRLAQRALFDVAFATPAGRTGSPRWGIKEVRWTSDHARYLRWLYPRCRLVFLVRNPLKAYESYLRRGGGWYRTYPGTPIHTPQSFGQHWHMTASSFVNDADELDAMVLRYEDVVSSRSWIAALETHLRIRIDETTLDSHLDGTSPESKPIHLGFVEKWLLKRAVAPLAEQLGYSW